MMNKGGKLKQLGFMLAAGLLLCALAGCGGATHTHEAIVLDSDTLAVWVTASEGRDVVGLCYMQPAGDAKLTDEAGNTITADELLPGQLIRAVDKNAAEAWTDIYPPNITPDEVTVLGEADADAFAAALQEYDDFRGWTASAGDTEPD